MSTVQTKQTNLREKLAELLDFRKMRDRLSGLGLYIGKDRTGTDENLLVRGGANVDDLQIGEIAALVGGTAVDVFVYDTGRDSDGGKWRERTQHTSWYNEELNTATRGARREFPAVAVIVAEVGKVTIYDGDDPDLRMWMVFDVNNDVWLKHTTGNTVKSVEMLNAKLVTAGFRLSVVDFIDDSGYVSESSYCYEHNNISRRNIDGVGAATGNIFIVNNLANDVAMTILPNAPIDENTGLPVPTIAVATDGGVSIIRDNGNVVVDISVAGDANHVSFTKNNLLVLGRESNIIYVGEIPASDISDADWRSLSTTTYVGSSGADLLCFDDDVSALESLTCNDISVGYDADSNLGLLTLSPDTKISTNGLLAYITSKYNTGWMPGDIKLATLSDTTVETIGTDSSELVNNGDFSEQFDQENDGWYDKPPSSGNTTPWIISEGVASHIGDGSYLRQNNVFETGKQYALTFTVTGIVILPIATGIGSTTQNITFGAGTHTYVGTAISGNLQFYSNTTTTIDNVSVRETTELITNGDFSNGTTGWTSKSGASISESGGQLTAVCAGNYDGVQVDSSYFPSLESGKQYVMSVDVASVSSGLIAFGVVSGSIYENIASSGTYSSTFTASTTTEIFIDNRNSGSSTFVLNDVSIRPAEDDRSVNNNGLQIVGEINKTPVAPGADLVAYSGFSENDYLVQPYNEDLNFGTGDFCMMGWVNLNSQTSNKHIFAISDGQGTTWGDNGYIACKWNGPSSRFEFSYAVGGLLFDDGFSNSGWQHFALVREGGIIKMYTNSNYITENVGSASLGVTNSDSHMVLGAAYYNSSLAGHSNYYLSLFRISKTAPTAAQIAKIYRDEKALFQDGAQATLYGSSDAVTALSYDEKTELLHVGTASGRSDFSGLRRINNTTTAITTSISAHNNLIAEQ